MKKFLISIDIWLKIWTNKSDLECELPVDERENAK
jgi:hypothetical protein